MSVKLFFHRWFTVPNAKETLSFQHTLSFGNCWKSAEAKSIEYSGWLKEEMLFPPKNCNTQIKECAGTAHWWRINTQSPHNYPCLCLTESISVFNISTSNVKISLSLFHWKLHFDIWTKLMTHSDLTSYCSTNTERSSSRFSIWALSSCMT